MIRNHMLSFSFSRIFFIAVVKWASNVFTEILSISAASLYFKWFSFTSLKAILHLLGRLLIAKLISEISSWEINSSSGVILVWAKISIAILSILWFSICSARNWLIDLLRTTVYIYELKFSVFHEIGSSCFLNSRSK